MTTEGKEGWRGGAALLGGVVAVGLLATSRQYLPFVDAMSPSGRMLFSLGFLLLAGLVAGQGAAMIGLPRLTGYLAAGLLFGPGGVAIVGREQVTSMALLNALALALIALQAGAEFTTDMLRRGLRSLTWGSAAQVLVVLPGMALQGDRILAWELERGAAFRRAVSRGKGVWL
ncbi:MAG: hypothetical protein HY904_25305 [Deltaproteobacteria bacterium]|nr:hypothetical protein [Deltaproteobacteria bacterium]